MALSESEDVLYKADLDAATKLENAQIEEFDMQRKWRAQLSKHSTALYIPDLKFPSQSLAVSTQCPYTGRTHKNNACQNRTSPSHT